MSRIDTILTRMMQDAAFAEAVFVNAGPALSEYNLAADELAQFKGMSRTDFETLAAASPEERKSLASGSMPLESHSLNFTKITFKDIA